MPPDEDVERLWEKSARRERILRFGRKDNFWQMGETGPVVHAARFTTTWDRARTIRRTVPRT